LHEHAKTYREAPKGSIGWPVGRQKHKMTKISITTKVRVFAGACREISTNIGMSLNQFSFLFLFPL